MYGSRRNPVPPRCSRSGVASAGLLHLLVDPARLLVKRRALLHASRLDRHALGLTIILLLIASTITITARTSTSTTITITIATTVATTTTTNTTTTTIMHGLQRHVRGRLGLAPLGEARDVPNLFLFRLGILDQLLPLLSLWRLRLRLAKLFKGELDIGKPHVHLADVAHDLAQSLLVGIIWDAVLQGYVYLCTSLPLSYHSDCHRHSRYEGHYP